MQDTQTTSTFVWRFKPHTEGQDKGNEPVKSEATIGIGSTPIIQQGYWSGRLAEEFWTAIGMPDIPTSHWKRLRVIPLTLKSSEQNLNLTKHLMDKSDHSSTPIALIHVGLLAGIPWTQSRAWQHVGNEVAQALHKVFIFTNKIPNPLKKWTHGSWAAQWKITPEGEHWCMLYVTISVHEQQLNFRKGKIFEWWPINPEIWEQLNLPPTKAIHKITTGNTI